MAKASDKQRAECNKFLTSIPPPVSGPDTDCMAHLQTVSCAFYQAYQQRQTADYDTVKQWTRTEALAIIDSVDAAFKAWPPDSKSQIRAGLFALPLRAIRRGDRAITRLRVSRLFLGGDSCCYRKIGAVDDFVAAQGHLVQPCSTSLNPSVSGAREVPEGTSGAYGGAGSALGSR
jgi:hypothetical protein